MNSYVDKIIISILQPKKLRLTGVKYLAQGHRLVSGGFGLKHKTLWTWQLLMRYSLEKAFQGVPYMQTGALCTWLTGLQDRDIFASIYPSIHALISPTNIH